MESQTGSDQAVRFNVDKIVKEHATTHSGISFSADEINGRTSLSIVPPGIDRKMVITSRTLDEMDMHLRGVKKALLRTKGKVVFLGNGLSDSPLTVAERYKQGRVGTPPVVVDVFDYQKINYDLLSIYEDLSKEGIDPEIYIEQPLSRAVKSSERLFSAIKDGSVIAVQMKFPSGSIPECMLGADVVVNCFGPQAYTQDEMDQQLLLLKKNGMLFTTEGSGVQAPGLQRRWDGKQSVIINKKPSRFNLKTFLHLM